MAEQQTKDGGMGSVLLKGSRVLYKFCSWTSPRESSKQLKV